MHTARLPDGGWRQSRTVRGVLTADDRIFSFFLSTRFGVLALPTCLLIQLYFFLRDLTRTYLSFACTTYS
jgi:hypothetical protein